MDASVKKLKNRMVLYIKISMQTIIIEQTTQIRTDDVYHMYILVRISYLQLVLITFSLEKLKFCRREKLSLYQSLGY